MKIYEMKRDGRYDIGFIDPNTINQETWTIETSRKDTEKLARVFEVTKYPTRNTTSLQLRVSVTVLYYKFYFAYSMLSVVDELCMPAYTNMCTVSTGPANH